MSAVTAPYLGRTIRKVNGGGGGGEKNKKTFMQGKMRRKKIRAKRKLKKKSHAEGRSNYYCYLIYKICQCLLKIILIENILCALPYYF